RHGHDAARAWAALGEEEIDQHQRHDDGDQHDQGVLEQTLRPAHSASRLPAFARALRATAPGILSSAHLDPDFGGTAPRGATSYVFGSSLLDGLAGAVAAAGGRPVGQCTFGFSTNISSPTTITTATAAAISNTLHVVLSARLNPSAIETGVLISL